MTNFVLFLVLVLLALVALCVWGDPYRSQGHGFIRTAKRARRLNAAKTVGKGGATCRGSL